MDKHSVAECPCTSAYIRNPAVGRAVITAYGMLGQPMKHREGCLQQTKPIFDVHVVLNLPGLHAARPVHCVNCRARCSPAQFLQMKKVVRTNQIINFIKYLPMRISIWNSLLQPA